MCETSCRPIRQSGWAAPFPPFFFSRPFSRPRFPGPWVRLVGLLCLVVIWGVSSAKAQHVEHGRSTHADRQEHQHGTTTKTTWEGSVEGIAYSEFNHHLAGVFILLIALSEVRQAMGWPALAWTRFLLPGALTLGGVFLLIWSDHEAWPVGSLTFVQTFFGDDPEILQHKTYGILACAVGTIEFLRRQGWFAHAAWTIPLPLFAIVGGLMLFSHSHGDHPAAHKIALHHAIMGTMAITAGSAKFMSGWRPRQLAEERSYWELAWAGLVLVIGLQLLIYSE